MLLQTYSQIYNKAVAEMDLGQEPFLQTDEMLGYMNEAIDNAETCIHTLGAEDAYFLTPGTITLVNGTQDYAFPTDIYATKLRKVFYVNGSTRYPIPRLRRLESAFYSQAGDLYSYLIINSSISGATGGMKMRFYPIPAESGAYISIFYIRNMRRLTSSLVDADNVCEVPECVNFIHQHLRWNIARKMRRADLMATEKEALVEQYNLMAATLKEMVPDDNNQVLQDWSAYTSQDLDYYYP